MNWQEHLKKFQNKSGREIKIGIRDWEHRSNVFLKWIKKDKLNKRSRILDCGCGIGVAGFILKENEFRNVIGIDIDPRRLSIAKKNYKGVYRMNCENVKFNKRFDIILALNVIEHLNNPEKFLKRVKELLATSGRLILSLPNEIFIRRILRLIPKDPTHKQHWSYLQFKRFLKKCGFEILDMKPIGHVPFLFGCQTFMVLAKMKN
jgi:2-polyprenyl-3-methyl-5-hydroxy-6-metoxy-1,4-benzoquinol methylase